jgi:adenine-specific DNA-methyltransferase
MTVRMLTGSKMTLFPPLTKVPPVDKSGAVYTRRWTVELILDLAGYTADRDLVTSRALEPSCGEGSFLCAMAERLLASCRRQRRPVLDCARSIIAYELHAYSAEAARTAVADTLTAAGVSAHEAKTLALGWIKVGDYLANAPRLPAVDFVIGNPPYIRLEDMGDDVVQFYRDTYPTMRGRADIYVGFFEAALGQLRPNGVCVYICADRWMSNQYGAGLRKLVTEKYAVDLIVQMHEADPFESQVAAYPAVTVLRKTSQGAVTIATMGAAAHEVQPAEVAERLLSAELPTTNSVEGLRAARVETWVRGTSPWPCTSPERLALLQRLEAEFQPLEDEATGTRVSIGVATGCDRVYVTKDPTLVEESRLLRLAMVADTLAGETRWGGHFLVNPWTDEGLVDLKEFPKLAKYFKENAEVLKARNVARRRPDTWFRTIDRVHTALTAQPKLYFPDMRDTIHPVLDEGTTYPHHNLYFLVSEQWDLDVLGGILMSEVGQFFVESYGVRMRGGWLRFQAQYLRRIRVPRRSEVTAKHAKMLRDAFRTRDVQKATKAACEIYGIHGGIPRG